MSVMIPRCRLILGTALLFLSFFTINGISQSAPGFLKGRVIDAFTAKTLYDVTVEVDTSNTHTYADGQYLLSLTKGSHTVNFSSTGFETKTISGVKIQSGSITYLDIILFPVIAGKKDSTGTNTFYKEKALPAYNSAKHSNEIFDIISTENIQPGNDKNAAQLLKRLNGVIVEDNFRQRHNQSLNLFGFGERHNQVLFNGAILPNFDAVNRSYPFDLLPSESIEEVKVQKISNASLPADFTGGNLEIRTKDFPDYNFFYVQAGAGFSADTKGKDFFGNKRGKTEFLGFANNQKDLPTDFPTIRSPSTLNQKNPQEQVYLSRQLTNNLAPVNHSTSIPDDRVLLGYGKIFKLKTGTKIGIIAFLNHQRSELIDGSVVQVAPNVINNPYPFADVNKPVINSLANDINYRYSARLSGIVNASVIFGRNKISLRNVFGSTSSNTYTERTAVFKPDEDTLAHNGVNYISEQGKFLNTQLSGVHALGEDGSFKFEWQASYLYYKQHNPDERNFLLQQGAGNTYQVAKQSTASLNSVDLNFTNTGRLWRDYTDHNFNGSVKLSVPFSISNKKQVLSGGLSIQTRYRIFYSDLLLTQGTGYFSLDGVIAPERYFPGGTSARNYYTRAANLNLLNYNNRGNYTASANLGAAYIMLESQLTNSLSINWGLRMESNTQLVSNTQYSYFAGFRNPRILPIDQNAKVTKFEVLPSANLLYHPIQTVELHAAYFKTVSRPQLQELSAYRYYDALSFSVKTGNPLLENSIIDNYDGGIRWFINSGSDISVSGFYKKIYQPIEYVQSFYANAQGIMLSTPHNAPSAESKGINASVKINLDFISPASWLSAVSLFANGTLLKSNVKGGPIKSMATPEVASHSLSGNPEQSLNAGLVIQDQRFPCLTILYARTGDYVSAVGSGSLVTLGNGKVISAVPDYRVKGRDQLDIQVSQKLFRSNFQVIAGVNNLLSSDYLEYQDLNGNEKFDEPLVLKTNPAGKGGFFQSGTDNTIMRIKSQRAYYLTVSYLFR